MDPTAIKAACSKKVARGETACRRRARALRDLPFKDLGFASVDHHRALRTGVPEVVFGSGKTPSRSRHLREHRQDGQNALARASSAEPARACSRALPELRYDAGRRASALLGTQQRSERAVADRSRSSRGHERHPRRRGSRAAAGSLGNGCMRLFDVGVAGLHRLLAHARRARQRRASIIVVAGMEGALPSVVGGLVARAGDRRADVASATARASTASRRCSRCSTAARRASPSSTSTTVSAPAYAATLDRTAYAEQCAARRTTHDRAAPRSRATMHERPPRMPRRPRDRRATPLAAMARAAANCCSSTRSAASPATCSSAGFGRSRRAARGDHAARCARRRHPATSYCSRARARTARSPRRGLDVHVHDARSQRATTRRSARCSNARRRSTPARARWRCARSSASPRPKPRSTARRSNTCTSTRSARSTRSPTSSAPRSRSIIWRRRRGRAARRCRSAAASSRSQHGVPSAGAGHRGAACAAYRRTTPASTSSW